MKFTVSVVCAVLATSCVAHHSPRPFGFHIEFNHAVGLKPGDQVCLLGVPVGKVEHIGVRQRSGSTKPVVDVEVSLSESKALVRKADSFRIDSWGLLGDEYLEIDPAKVQSPPVANGSSVSGEEVTLSPKMIAELQPLLADLPSLIEIGRKLSALPPRERKSMMERFLDLLGKTPEGPSSSHESANHSINNRM